MERHGKYMKYLIQFAIISGITFLGEMLNLILPFSIPASVYGLVILLVALLSGVIKLEQVEETADFFNTIMPVLFLAPAVSMMDVLPKLGGSILPILIITVVSTVVVMAVTGRVSQAVIRHGKKKGRKENE